MENRNEKNAKVFKAFCDGKRLAILELLQGSAAALSLLKAITTPSIGTQDKTCECK